MPGHHRHRHHRHHDDDHHGGGHRRRTGRYSTSSVGRRNRSPARSAYRPFGTLFSSRLAGGGGGRGYNSFNDMLRLFEYGHVASGGEDEDEVDAGVGGAGDEGAAAAATITRQPSVPKPDPRDQDVLRVESVDLRVAGNAKRHNTDQYDVTEGPGAKLVVRRGQEFTIQIDFSRQYNAATDDLRIVFQIGDTPKPSKGTHVEFILSDKDEADQWGAKLVQQTGKAVVITVFTPPDCIVGQWRLKVDVVKRKDNQTSVFRYSHKGTIYMLFNPWCKGDSVYLENPAEREAYVLNDKGKIYSGNYKRISPKPWVFGQFSGKVLDCCMYLLDVSELNLAVRGNPIPIVRKLTAMVNSQDDGGVLTGNWSGDYSGGKSPLSWTGSAAILEQYYQQKYSVQFGQCWVFSGVLTTVLRALGIPARSVTNFASAHDVDTSITIDMHYDEDGNPLEDMNEDSVWNFHVWNEVWMSRPDLKAGYGGWQACDATPQETSDDVYCCGPCPVRAIKEGEVNLPFDGPFVFAEVNADKVYWMLYKNGESKNVHVEKNSVGKFISTMSLRGEREDVTKHYKYPEDSAEERVAVRRANQVGSSRRDVYKEGPKDVVFELTFDSDNTFVGEDCVVVLRCKNNSKEVRGLYVLMCANSMYYTGVVADQVAKQPVDLILKPGESKEVSMKVSPERYLRKLKDCCMLSISAMARVVETKQIFTKKDDVRLRKPHLNIKAPSNGKVGEEFEVQVSFTNPMPATLTDCYVEVEGPGLTKARQYPQGDVQAKGTFLTTLRLKPAKQGQRHIVVMFNARQLEGIDGTHDINVVA